MADTRVEEQIALWRGYVRRRRAIDVRDVDELEDHLRNGITQLGAAGLTDDEAFLVAVKRMGSLDALSREFAREHSERLWKQLVLASDTPESSSSGWSSDAAVAVGLGAAAAVALKVPELFGHRIGEPQQEAFYLRNLSLFVLPFLAGYFAWKRRLTLPALARVMVPILAAALVVNAYPYVADGSTFRLTVLHVPIALWLIVGIAYVGGGWFTSHARMDFVRFSGEWVIYYVLIALGGGVLTGFTVFMFAAIGTNAEWFVQRWLVPSGAAGAVLVSAWLVEAKQSVVENMAPVLTRIFTPLFTLVLLVFLATMIWTGGVIDVRREVLIGFDLLLVLVVGLLLYAISARDPRAPAGPFDSLQLVLVIAALAVDVVALTAIAGRISDFGFTPNRVAALGENLILLVNLAGSAWLYGRFLMGRTTFAALERWQVAYLPVYSIWAAAVVLLFPPLFQFR
jgi:hypothetical protein